MVETLSGLLFFLSAFYGNTEISVAAPAPLTPVADNPITLEQYVRDYFADNPVLSEIAKCESRFRHFDRNGVLRGDYDRNDVGVMQINERYHAERAQKLGFDIKTLEDNLSYAKWLYEKEGLKPWASSGKCWKGAQTLAVAKNTNQKN
ncbi:MAG: hypothetical protein Q8R17_01255 [bacterium]|nr:hypothetical protein [bacterium]